MAIDILKTQQNLTKAGYPAGPTDGSWGPSTATGLLCYGVKKKTPDSVLRGLGQAMGTYLKGSNTVDLFASPERLIDYLSQCAVETGGFSVFEENMRYTAERLMVVWPSRFKTIAQAKPYAGNPKALSNLVYGARMGNELNGINDDDGWENRGGGLCMHTGAAEYKILKDNLGITPDQVRHDPISQVRASLDYWYRRKVASFIDRGDTNGARKAVNGGLIGIDEVNNFRTRFRNVIA
jgi:putative chitinase